MRIRFDVHGKPAQQGSKRIVPTKAGPRVIEDNDARKKDWRRAVVDAAAAEMNGRDLLTGPIEMLVIFWFYRPAAHFGSGRNNDKLKPSAPQQHAQSPDLDKLLRNVCDALSGIVFRDDRQVCRRLIDRDPAGNVHKHIVCREVQACPFLEHRKQKRKSILVETAGHPPRVAVGARTDKGLYLDQHRSRPFNAAQNS